MKQITTLFILCFIVFPFLHSCSKKQDKEIEGSYQVVNKKISITDYDEIFLLIDAEVVYEQISYETPYLQITTDENILSHLDISVKDNRLIISQKIDSLLAPSQLKIFTNSKNLKNVNISGKGNLLMKRHVNAQHMNIVVSGEGVLEADSLYCENIKVEIVESGNVAIKGASTNAYYKIGDKGSIHAFDYLTEKLECIINDTGDIEAYVHDSLIALVQGIGELKYKGKAEVLETENKGLGKIIRVEN